MRSGFGVVEDLKQLHSLKNYQTFGITIESENYEQGGWNLFSCLHTFILYA